MNSKKITQTSEDSSMNDREEARVSSDLSAKTGESNQQKKKLSWRRILKIGGTIALCLVILGAVFIGGIEIGKKYYPSINLIHGVENAETNKPQNVDFSLFWDAWHYLEEYYVKASQIDYQKMVYGAIKGMVDSLGDPYTVFFEPDDAKKFTEDVSGNFSGIGIEIGVKNNAITVISPIEDTPAWKAGLRAGDKILAIDKTSTDGLTLDDAVKMIRGDKGTSVTLTIMREGFNEPKDFTIVRDIINVPAAKLTFLDNGIAHLELLNFNENASDEFTRAATQVIMKNSSGIILDLRNNPGGYLESSVDIAGWFLKRGDIVVRERESDNREKLFRASGNQALLNLPVVILANEGTASASEILAGALRDNRNIKIIGTKTFGKGSVQTLLPLADNSMLKITIAEWLTPNGTAINDVGISPDYEVNLTEEQWEANQDPQLDKAIEILKNELRG
ncbi:MAG TPA: S41 family peptidase [Candidatus Paceibacterota bacterium]|nr:S41 family peptidase [Candidatus Paceibacterota bacterium]HOL53809.1 S41 family peptidase [Candidatus Paceibacterota bacterium]HON21572.1 S41 family peptidase [Candidatus Paceibacterota bacterium]HPP16950.1 S41 family peptidase [Candidatus Paceibacterota bacterium]HRU33447.1 S41 family peptidase [Candidatus Paceibacterota bacterium]